MDDPTARFTGRMGLLFEADGHPRIAGRIFAYLLVSDGPRSLDELARTLRVSKASASTNARLLAATGVLERVSRPARPARLLPRGPRPVHPQRGRAAQALGALHRGTRRGAADPAEPESPRPGAAPGYEAAYTYLVGAIGQALDRWEQRHCGSPAGRRGDRAVRRRALLLLSAALSGRVRGDPPGVGRARGVAGPADPLDAPAERDPPGHGGRYVRTGAACPPTWATASGGSPSPRSWRSACATTPAPSSPGPTRRPRPRRTAPSGARSLPTIDGDVTAARLKTVASQGRTAVQQSVLTPSVTLSYLLFDFGGRSGRIRAPAAAAAVRRVHPQRRPSRTSSCRSRWRTSSTWPTARLLIAQRTTLAEAQANLAAAEERRRVGLATIADVLQARTAASQAQLDLQTTEGNLQTARGALALALGLPANLPYDVDSDRGGACRSAALADSVDALIASALARAAGPGGGARGGGGGARAASARRGPAAALAQPRRHRGPHLRDHHSRRRQQLQPVARPRHPAVQRLLPGSTTCAPPSTRRRRRPARSETIRQQVVYQVFSAYYALQTATRRVRTAEDLIASAQQSSEVASARYKAGVGHRARPAGGAERARERPGAAGRRPPRLERLAGAAGARRRRARPAGRQFAPSDLRHHHGASR